MLHITHTSNSKFLPRQKEHSNKTKESAPHTMQKIKMAKYAAGTKICRIFNAT